MEKLIEALRFIKKRAYFIDGLIVELALAATVYFFLASKLEERIISTLHLIFRPISPNLQNLFFIIGLLIFLTVPVVIWLVYRSVSQFRKSELGIIFAPNFDDETEIHVKRLLVNFIQEIKSHELANNFSVKRIPPNKAIDSKEDAISILKKCGGIAAVWGSIEHTNTEEGITAGFSRISFTIVHRPAVLHPERFKNILSTIIGKRWRIDERTILADRQILVRDLSIVVRNLIGLVLIINRKYGEAIKIYGPLYLLLTQMGFRQDIVECRKLYNQIRMDFANCLTFSGFEEYIKKLYDGRIFQISTDVIEKWLHNVERAIKLDSQNSTHYLAKAIYQFLLGDIQKAIRSEITARKLSPLASATPYLSLAFLYNFIEEFEKSKSAYARGLSKKTSYNEDLIKQCVMFIRQVIEKYPEKKQLRYAFGFLVYHRIDEEKGRKELKSFVKCAGEDEKYLPLIKEATKLLADQK